MPADSRTRSRPAPFAAAASGCRQLDGSGGGRRERAALKERTSGRLRAARARRRVHVTVRTGREARGSQRRAAARKDRMGGPAGDEGAGRLTCTERSCAHRGGRAGRHLRRGLRVARHRMELQFTPARSTGRSAVSADLSFWASEDAKARRRAHMPMRAAVCATRSSNNQPGSGSRSNGEVGSRAFLTSPRQCGAGGSSPSTANLLARPDCITHDGRAAPLRGAAAGNSRVQKGETQRPLGEEVAA